MVGCRVASGSGGGAAALEVAVATGCVASGAGAGTGTSTNFGFATAAVMATGGLAIGTSTGVVSGTAKANGMSPSMSPRTTGSEMVVSAGSRRAGCTASCAFAGSSSQVLHAASLRASASAASLQPLRAHQRLSTPRQLLLSVRPHRMHARPDGDGRTPWTYRRGNGEKRRSCSDSAARPRGHHRALSTLASCRVDTPG